MSRMGIVITALKVSVENKWLIDKRLKRSKKQLDAKPLWKS